MENRENKDSKIENLQECIICKKNSITFCCMPCRCAILCKSCAMKMATGGICKNCKNMFTECRKIQS